MIHRLFRNYLILLLGLLILAGCSGVNDRDQAQKESIGKKIVVYTTIFPLYDFTRNVAGDRVEVVNLLPPGADPHHWEPEPADLVRINQADAFIYCGAGLESWLENVLKNTDRNRITIVDSSKGIPLLQGVEGSDLEENLNDQHDHSGIDPHIWLSPANAAMMVDNIREGMVKADPANKELYLANAQSYKEKLANLDNEYKISLSRAKVKQLVVSHAAFGYLTKRYGLEQVAIRGFNAEIEPTPARLAEIVETVKKQKIRYIFSEALVSPKVSETLAAETGAKILLLNPVGELTKKELSEGKSYLSIMKENLTNIKIACEVE